MNTRPKSAASRRGNEVTKGKLKIKDLGRRQATTKNLPADESEAIKGGRTPVDHTIEVP